MNQLFLPQIICCTALFFGGALPSAFGEPTPREALLAISKGEHMLAIVDPATLRVIAKMPVGPDPHEVVASSDGKLAYVSNYGGGAYDTLTLVDLDNQKTLSTIDLGPLKGPHGLAYVKDKVWFTAEGAKAIGNYDPAKNRVDFILGTGQNRTHMIHVSEDLKQVITTNVSSGTISLIEKTAPPATSGHPSHAEKGPPPGPPLGPPGGDWDQTLFAAGKGVEGFDVSPNGKEAWAASAGDGTITILDLNKKKVSMKLKANVPGANRLKFTNDGKMVLVSLLHGKKLVVFDSSSRKEVKRIDIGKGAAGIQMHPDGTKAYVASTEGDFVAVIDLKTLTIKDKIDVGQGPDGLAWLSQK